jgi:1-acyl-sn-glycerol-3-phosphate acyltransferase
MGAYRLARGLFLLIAGPMFRFQVSGAERIPRNGACVVVAPHRSWLDPACVGGACPRPVRFLIMDRVYRMRRAHWFYRAMKTIPVSPDGRNSVGALRAALKALQAGELVGVFPEGRVYPSARPGPVQPGAALLAVRSGAPVVPLFIHGSAEAWPHHRRFPAPAAVSVRVGPTLEVPPGRGRSAVEELVRSIEQAWARLALEGVTN